jgi:DNA-directed RNA polymerase specialized sigma24 family protein|tara:strand:- start:389 stop:985 length:597 start_codon:yes stop_codon:yes gene_type:complete
LNIPDNYSEEEVIDIINIVADRLCYKFKFGYHSADDMKQQARLFAWEGMEKYDEKRPLENFLWTHVRNRLYNFKRNNYSRLEKPCDTCEFYISKKCTAFDDQMECSLYKGWSDRNSAKKSLMHSISVDFDQKEEDNSVLGTIQSKELVELVDSELHVSFREDWIRFINNLKLSKTKKDRLVEEIKNVLEENNIDTQTW